MKRILTHIKENWIRHGFETLAVLVGVLTAFALNHWNETRKRADLEIQYLERILVDLAEDTAYFNTRRERAERVRDSHIEFIRNAYENQRNLDEARSLLKTPRWDAHDLTTQNFTYIELTNSGDLNIFRNEEIKDAIVEYYTASERAAAHFREFNATAALSLVEISDVIRDFLKFFLNDEIYDDPSMFDEVDWQFVNDPSSEKFQTIENTSNIYYSKHIVFVTYFRDLKSQATSLMQLLGAELERRK